MSNCDITPRTITVVVNGTVESTTAPTLQAWVDAHSIQPTAVATAVNGSFVSRSLRSQLMLMEGDAIVTFQPIEGG